MTPNGKKSIHQTVVIIAAFMLNIVKNGGLSKMRKVDVLNFPWAYSTDILTKIDNALGSFM